MYLKALLAPFTDEKILLDCALTGLSQDSRTIQKGNVFFAFPGIQSDGRCYIQQAIQKGAAAIVMEKNNSTQVVKKEEIPIPIIYILNLNEKLSEIAARFYGNPGMGITLIGVTGTNGKTSCTHFLAACLAKTDRKCGVIGGNGNFLYTATKVIRLQKKDDLTTSDAIEIQRVIAEFKASNVTTVVIEVSSHGLVQHRLKAVPVCIAAFTNLTHDHLDYHQNLDDYANAKKILFQKPTVQYAIFNTDDAIGFKWQFEFQKNRWVYTYGTQKKVHSVASTHCTASHINAHLDGVTAKLDTPWGAGTFHNSFLLGKFNISNVLLVVTVMGILNISFGKILNSIHALKPVTGRMQIVSNLTKQLPLIIIDYAHTPDALEQVLSFLRASTRGQVWCVFGCGGNRDPKKRPKMGKIAEKYSDHIVLTQDNSRFEESRTIFNHIVSGCQTSEKVWIIFDRKQAIHTAIQEALPCDVVLVAGKGHENYQMLGKHAYPFSDYQMVQFACQDKIKTLGTQ